VEGQGKNGLVGEGRGGLGWMRKMNRRMEGRKPAALRASQSAWQQHGHPTGPPTATHDRGSNI